MNFQIPTSNLSQTEIGEGGQTQLFKFEVIIANYNTLNDNPTKNPTSYTDRSGSDPASDTRLSPTS